MSQKCEICGATENIQKYYASYEPEIMQLLCMDCYRYCSDKAIHKAAHNPILRDWDNKTQIISLFVTKGARKNTLVGFNIVDKYRDMQKGISFTPSYDQIVSFLMALDVSQGKSKKGDEKFWLDVAYNALIALSKRDEWYDGMLGVIREKRESEDLDKKINFF